MPPPKLANPLALAVLVLLFEKDMHPYEMAATLKERKKEDSIKLRYGSLYTVIGLLEREKLIAPFKTSRAGRRPERTVYRITPAGTVEMRAWLQSILSAPVKEYPLFEAGLSLLPAVAPQEAVGLLEARAQRLDETIASHGQALGSSAKKIDPLFLIESEYHLEILKAERRFVQNLVGHIKGETWPSIKIWKSVHARGRGKGGFKWEA
jgi:DNA-binding PadR family transcriptional regulator